MNPYVMAWLIGLGVAFYGGWTVNDWRHDAEQKQAVEQAAADQREFHRLEQARISAALGAQVLARKSEARLRADSAASQSALVGLQDATAGALRAAALSHAACTAVSAAYSELLTDSAASYRALATKADEHLIDLRVQINTP